MNGQQLCALLIVTVAAAYLGRNFVTSARSFFANKSGCGGGCGKCAFAEQNRSGKKPLTSAAASKPQANLIALGDIQTLPRKRSSN